MSNACGTWLDTCNSHCCLDTCLFYCSYAVLLTEASQLPASEEGRVQVLSAAFELIRETEPEADVQQRALLAIATLVCQWCFCFGFSCTAWSFLYSLRSRYASYTILRLCCSIWINRLLCCRYCIVLNWPIPMLRRVSPSSSCLTAHCCCADLPRRHERDGVRHGHSRNTYNKQLFIWIQ